MHQYRTSMLWHILRMSRSRPPGLAGEDERRANLYRASIQQFEELLSAAASIGPAAATSRRGAEEALAAGRSTGGRRSQARRRSSSRSSDGTNQGGCSSQCRRSRR